MPKTTITYIGTDPLSPEIPLGAASVLLLQPQRPYPVTQAVAEAAIQAHPGLFTSSQPKPKKEPHPQPLGGNQP